MKIVTVLGTRPELIRLSLIIAKLDSFCEHTLVHTGQNYDKNLKDVFMLELNIREPDYYLDAKGSFGKQVGVIFEGLERVFHQIQPDRVLILGDTNSGLAAVVAKRIGIPVYHMEAGNRCYDDRVPEEINRRVIDHSSDILLPYTERSRTNLLAEGISSRRIFVTGNPIYEVLTSNQESIDDSKILERLRLQPKSYFLVTLHRAENVDDLGRMGEFVFSLNRICEKYKKPVLWSVHPRTLKQLRVGKFKLNERIQCHDPFGLFDFVKLEKNALCVLSDSGTVQEECSIFSVPTVTLRDVTERPETMEVGSNIIAGGTVDSIVTCVDLALRSPCNWRAPDEYLVDNVSDTVLKILFSKQPG